MSFTDTKRSCPSFSSHGLSAHTPFLLQCVKGALCDRAQQRHVVGLAGRNCGSRLPKRYWSNLTNEISPSPSGPQLF